MSSYTYGLINEKDIEELVKLVNGYDFSKKVSVEFSKNIEFVHPFYFILLFQNAKANNKGVILDISSLAFYVQGYIHRFLTQYLDFNDFKVENKSEDYQFLDSFSYLITTKHILDTLIYSEEDDNTYLPIININPSKERYKENQGNIKTRKDTYQAFVIDDNKHEESTYSIRIHNEIKNMLEALNFAQSKHEAIRPFVDLFSELVDNIRKHTDIQTNEQTDAHICFFHDTKINNNEKSKLGSFQLIISDSYQGGFLDRYMIVLKDEIKRFTKEKIPKKALISFVHSIRELKNGNFEEILKSLFSIDSLSTEHQIPRLVMHFGIPMILKIIQCFLGKEQGAKIEVYLCSKSKNISYKVQVEITATEITPDVKPITDLANDLYINGSHIIITLPYDIKYDDDKCNPKDFTNSNLVMKNNDFTAIYKKRTFDEIKEAIQTFPEIKPDGTTKNAFDAIQKTINTFLEIKLDGATQKTFDAIQETINTFLEIKPNGAAQKVCQKIQHIINEFLKIKPDGAAQKVCQEIQHIINEFLKIKPDVTAQIKSETIAIDYKKYVSPSKKVTFSEFIRELYLCSYKNSFKAVVVYNVHSDAFNSHLRLLFEIIYFSNKNKEYNKPLDIVFYDEASPRAMLIGGKNKEEFLSLNRSIGNRIKDTSNQDKENPPQETKSPLIYKIMKEGEENPIEKWPSFLLPFELFEILNAENQDDYYDFFKGMVKNFLNQNTIDNIRLDTQRGYYVDKYNQFKMLFQNSVWTKRIAFKLAVQLRDKEQFDYIIGTDKYTSQIISLLKTYVGSSDCDDEIVNPNEKYPQEHLSNLKNKRVLILSSVVFDGKCTEDNIYDVIKKSGVKNIDRYAIISIKKQSNIGNFIELDTPKEEEAKEFFKKKDDPKPLYRLRLDDSFEIENFYEEDYNPKKFKSYLEEEKKKKKEKDSKIGKEEFIPKWIGAAYFGHVWRGDNHYAFYTKTIEFYKSNCEQIKSFLKSLKTKIALQVQYKAVIIAPLHCTNSNFITDVNTIVFDNDATVISLDKSKGESNYHIQFPLLDNYKENLENTKIYFVDDEIASASTLQYCYLWVQRYFGEKKSFDGIITLIDRCSYETEMLMQHYLVKDENEINEKFHSFTALQIRPMKTIGSEECFLCKREKEYKNLLGLSALDLTRFNFAAKLAKLKRKKADEVDNDRKDKDMYYTKMKDFIKMYAVHYIYENFREFTDSDKYDNNLKYFQGLMYDYILKNEFRDINYEEERTLKAILNHESEIAIIKALSFPKLAYYKKIREAITEILHKRILDIDDDHETTNEKIIDEETSNSKNENFNTLIKIYKEKSNLDMINLYFSVLGYLRDPFLLKEKCLKLYAAMIKLNISGENGKKIKHGYLTAVKIVIADDKKLAKYFYDNQKFVRNRFLEDKIAKHLYNAMLIENNITMGAAIKKINTLDEFILDIKQMLNTFGIDINIKLKALYINELLNDDGDSYIKYLESENGLIDIYDNKTPMSDELLDRMKKLYYGAVSEKNSEDMKKLDKMPDLLKINDTWANYYDKDTNITIIKIVDTDVEKWYRKDTDIKVMDNSPIWFKPIGCIVIEHLNPVKSDNMRQHIQVVNAVLANQKILVEYIKEQATPIAIDLRNQKKLGKSEQKRIDAELKLREKDIEKYVTALSNISHSYKKFINIQERINQLIKEKKPLDEIIEMVSWFTVGLKYVFDIGSILPIKSQVEKEDLIIFEKPFIKVLENFSKAAHLLIKECEAFFEVKVDDKLREKRFDIESSSLQIFQTIVFELFFNIIKVNLSTENTIRIEIISENNCLYIANTGYQFKEEYKPVFEGKSIPYKGEENKNGTGMGLKTIYDYLKSIEYDIGLLKNGEKPNLLEQYDVIICIKPSIKGS